MSEQKPSIGRIVHYKERSPSGGDGEGGYGRDVEWNGSKVAPALITRVWSDTCVNLTIFPDNGVPYTRTSVYLLADEAAADSPAGGSIRCYWPPRV